MKILVVHNSYRYRGGEDEACDSEHDLLASRGHDVRLLSFDNRNVNRTGLIQAGFEASWSRESYNRARQEIARSRPDVLHIHNFFPLASPSVHYAACYCGVPVVQTLHNYRLLCPAATLFRKGSVCEDCLADKFPWRGIAHRCYRGSLVQTSAAAIMIGVHRIAGTWEKVVSAYIAVSEFEKRKFTDAGFATTKVHVKPNFVADSGAPGSGGHGLAYVGRLSEEKGIRTLLKAMEYVRSATPLRIVGDGPLENEVRTSALRDKRIDYCGRLDQRSVLRIMGEADYLILPSECYETFGRVAVEAFSRGTPVIAADIGAISEIVDNGRTGYHFHAGDARELAAKIDHAMGLQGDTVRLRADARSEFEHKYTPERNYALLMAIFKYAIENNSSPAPDSEQETPTSSAA